MHKTFISYHHLRDQDIKNAIVDKFGGDNFLDRSVEDGDINPELSEDTIMSIIRTEYLYDSTVTLVIVGLETAQRPYVNSEIQASLRDTTNNKHNGLLAVVRDEIYDLIYTSSTCSSCGATIRTRESAFYNYLMPDLIRKNHEYNGDKCHYYSNDVYCAVIKYSVFINEPERYINEAFDKRDNDSLEIRKTLSLDTPRIGGRR